MEPRFNSKLRRTIIAAGLSAAALAAGFVYRSLETSRFDREVRTKAEQLADETATAAATNIWAMMVSQNAVSGNVRPIEDLKRDLLQRFAVQDPPDTVETVANNLTGRIAAAINPLTVRLFKLPDTAGYCVGILAETQVGNSFVPFACTDEAKRPALPLGTQTFRPAPGG